MAGTSFGSQLLGGLKSSLTANPLGIATSLFGIGSGIAQSLKAKKLERANVRPVTTVNGNLVKNVGDAAIAAQTGLTDRVYNNALNQLNTGLNVGVRQIGRMGGTSSVASTLRAFGQGVNNLAAQDQQAQQANQRGLFNARTALAGEQQRVFNWNEAGKYNEMAQRIAQLRNAGQQNTFNGLTTLSTLTQPNPYAEQQTTYQPQTMSLLQPSTNFNSYRVNPTLQGFGNNLKF